VPNGYKGSYRDCPGFFGGFEYSPVAYSPLTSTVYQPGVLACLNFDKGNFAVDAHPAGFMAAINPATGTLRWKDAISKPMIGGSLATASNLVFSGADNGDVYAFDATTGKILWAANVGIAIGAPPITYEINGTQYLAIAAGGSNGAGFFRDKTGGTMVVFKLHGGPITKLPVVSGPSTSGLEFTVSLKGLTQVSPWIYENTAQQKVVFKVVAGYTTANNGFNFNGYAKGGANFIIPAGWQASFIFTNRSALPHSMAVTNTLQINATTAPYAETPDPIHGMNGTGTQYATVTTQGGIQAGKYYLVCLVPGHIQSGMWDNFTVSSTAKAPSIVAQ
jgi:uncharacterized cupredoxin-like copper-binding protein